MSKKQELNGLREGLSRWKSHNEVASRPADNMLYDLLDGILSVLEGEEVEDNDEVINEPESIVAPGGDEEGSNPPNGPGTPP